MAAKDMFKLKTALLALLLLGCVAPILSRNTASEITSFSGFVTEIQPSHASQLNDQEEMNLKDNVKSLLLAAERGSKAVFFTAKQKLERVVAKLEKTNDRSSRNLAIAINGIKQGMPSENFKQFSQKLLSALDAYKKNLYNTRKP